MKCGEQDRALDDAHEVDTLYRNGTLSLRNDLWKLEHIWRFSNSEILKICKQGIEKRL